MMRILTLQEYDIEPGVELSQIECDDLRRMIPSLSVMPSVGAPGHYDLKPGPVVGVAQLPDLAVEIRPKITIDRILFLVSYAIDPTRWRDDSFEFARDSSLLEALIPTFLGQVRRAFRCGLLQGYRAEEAALSTVRGRIRFDDQIRDRFGRCPPVEVRFDEFTEDIEPNRLIKAAIHRLGRMRIRSEPVRRSLRAYDSLLASVRLVEYDPRQLPEIRYDRLNLRYRPAVELAKLILRSISFEVAHGQIAAATFLLDMNSVFENFVIAAIRESLRVAKRDFPQAAAGKRFNLDAARKVRLEPDLSWWDGLDCLFVGDAKYKRISTDGSPNADLYQMLAYATAADLPGGILVYAAGEAESVVHQVVHVGKALEVRSLDLRGSPEEILEQVARLADRIRWFRDWGRRRRVEAATSR